MRIKAESIRRSLIGQARREIAVQAGDNEILSKTEQAKLPEDYRRAADEARQLKGSGARITVNDVVDVYAREVTQQLEAVNTVGATWLSKNETAAISDETLRNRIWEIRGAKIDPVTSIGGLPEAKLFEMAGAWIGLNAEWRDYCPDDPIFPHPWHHGENGLTAHAYAGDTGAKLADFAGAWFPGSQELANFDPERQMILAVETSDDEPGLYVSVMNRENGEVSHVGYINIVDCSYEISLAEFERIMGPLSEWSAGSAWSYNWTDNPPDHFEITAALLEGSTVIEIVEPVPPADGDDPSVTPGPVLHPFTCDYGDSGAEPDLSVFGAEIKTYEEVATDVGALFEGAHFNPALKGAGLTKDGCKALWDAIKDTCSEYSDDELRAFEYGKVNKLYAENGDHLGYDVTFSDDGGLIGGSVYVTLDDQATVGYGS